jgi:hypothetical protein
MIGLRGEEVACTLSPTFSAIAHPECESGAAGHLELLEAPSNPVSG